MATEFEYQRLPGKLVGVVRKASLWEGKDHLLSVSGTRFVESYRRFYYRDIEAIIVRRCVRFGSIGAWVLLVLAMMMSLVLLRIPALGLPAQIALGLLAGYRLIVALRFSCRCFVQTAVSREELPSLMRTWNLGPALERIRSRIRDEQGTLPNDFRAPTASDENESLVSGAGSEPRLIFQSKNVPAPSYSSAVYLALVGFVLCLVDAASSVYFLDSPTRPNSLLVRTLNALLTLLQGGVVLVALIRIHKQKSLRSLRNFLLAALCFAGFEIYLSNVISSLSTVGNGAAAIQMKILPVWHTVVQVDAFAALVIGFGGIILIVMNWENFRRGDLSAL